MHSPLYLWTATVLLWIGVVGATGAIPQKRLSLEAPLGTAIPYVLEGYRGTDVEVDLEEQRIAGFTSYLLRSYGDPGGVFEETVPAARAPSFSVYVGYYDGQTQGKTIHSPKNCLPGSGWEVLGSTTTEVKGPDGSVSVNRYLLQNKNQQALVLYWYQGRGRVQANEYAVKWDLLRDASLRQRSDEALVRIVVPITESEDASLHLARSVAQSLIPALENALPD